MTHARGQTPPEEEAQAKAQARLQTAKDRRMARQATANPPAANDPAQQLPCNGCGEGKALP